MANQRAIVPADGRQSPSPYSPGVRAGDFIFVSGCVPTDATGSVVGDDIASQTQAALENISRILEAAGSTLADIVRTTVYLTDMETFGGMNDAYRRAFPAVLPSRTTVEISQLAQSSYLVEIDAIAYAPLSSHATDDSDSLAAGR